MRKRIFAFLLSCLFILTLLGCSRARGSDNGRIDVICTLFPQYDFARQVAGDLANVTLLLPPGAESHSYEPTPQDVIAIDEADLFIYTGPYMEHWAKEIVESLRADTHVLDVSAGIELHKTEETDAAAGETHDAADDDHGGYDPHIWTDPVLAMRMVENIVSALKEADPENAGAYEANGTAYLAKLSALDRDLSDVVSAAKRREIYFGSRFAMYYFAKRYGLTCVSAYDSCSEETEPSAGMVARVVDAMRSRGIPVVYYEELVKPTVANTIAEETGAKALLLHSCHNVSKKEFEEGATYLSLMRQNLENLKEGLN